MKCPACDVPLTRQDYENVSVFQCPQCHGYLANRNRVRLIKSSRIQSTEDLETEWTAESQPDSRETIRCPRCRAGIMRKERIALDPENHFFIDVCPDCDVVWFNGGELARLQLDYERSAQAVEAYAMTQQAESRSPEDEAEFRSRLEALPKPANFLTLVTSGTIQAIVIAVLISAALAFVLWFILWG